MRTRQIIDALNTLGASFLVLGSDESGYRLCVSAGEDCLEKIVAYDPDQLSAAEAVRRAETALEVLIIAAFNSKSSKEEVN